MPEVLIQVKAFKCDRCGHVWQPHNIAKKPKTCPHCKNPFWDEPRKNKVGKAKQKTTKE